MIPTKTPPGVEQPSWLIPFRWIMCDPDQDAPGALSRGKARFWDEAVVQ